jgi:hypothetical protein
MGKRTLFSLHHPDALYIFAQQGPHSKLPVKHGLDYILNVRYFRKRAGIAFASITENAMASAAGNRKKKAVKRAKRSPSKKAAPKKKWSKRVMQTSDALDLENKIFTSKDPKKIARSLKRSAERSKRRKAGPLRSAMSMLNFYINRAGKNMTADEK